MTQPWEFMGYQKLGTATTSVTFNNVHAGTGNAASQGNMRFKLVAETFSDPANSGAGNGSYSGTAGVYTSATGQSGWTTWNNYGAVFNQTHNQQYVLSGSMQSGTGAGAGYSNGGTGSGWCMKYGNAGPYEPRSTSNVEDDLQWGVTTFDFDRQQNQIQGVFIRGINTQSQGPNNALVDYTWASWSTNVSDVAPTALAIFNNAQFMNGSKFWLWAQRANNNIV